MDRRSTLKFLGASAALGITGLSLAEEKVVLSSLEKVNARRYNLYLHDAFSKIHNAVNSYSKDGWLDFDKFQFRTVNLFLRSEFNAGRIVESDVSVKGNIIQITLRPINKKYPKFQYLYAKA